MNVTETKLKGVFIIEPVVFNDHRGFIYEFYQQEKFKEAGITCSFVQDNHSRSKQGVLRGLHFQAEPYGQAKLVRAVQGKIFDTAIDLRKGSPTFGQWTGAILSNENKKMLFIPDGFAHGFYVLSNTADVHYKCSRYYRPEAERSIIWNDPQLAIDWPLINNQPPILSLKDAEAPLLKDLL
ncbi:dTDP-4-dehydrorhamnose 3,5-epimerase [Thermoproteota archaeon]